LEILSSFPRKEVNTKVYDNFMAHNLDTKFTSFGVRTWEIWHRQGRVANQKNLDEADFMEPSLLLSQGGSHARKGGARPKAPKDINKTP
jgi:hypothetical protein